MNSWSYNTNAVTKLSDKSRRNLRKRDGGPPPGHFDRIAYCSSYALQIIIPFSALLFPRRNALTNEAWLSSWKSLPRIVATWHGKISPSAHSRPRSRLDWIFPRPQSFNFPVFVSVIISFRSTHFVFPSNHRRFVLYTRPKPIVTLVAHTPFNCPSLSHERSVFFSPTFLFRPLFSRH